MLFALLFACTTKAPLETPPDASVEPAAAVAPTAMVAPDAAPADASSGEDGIACDHEHGAEHIVAATVLPEFKDANGRLACPVMGDVVESAAEATSYADYDGVRYYFCCSSCAEKFAENPAAFADGKYLRQEGLWPASSGQG
jgi:YHS domain-containing protein